MGAGDEKPNDKEGECKHLNTRIFKMETHNVNQYSRKHICHSLLHTFAWYLRLWVHVHDSMHLHLYIVRACAHTHETAYAHAYICTNTIHITEKARAVRAEGRKDRRMQENVEEDPNAVFHRCIFVLSRYPSQPVQIGNNSWLRSIGVAKL
jgi:hypothetical protein